MRQLENRSLHTCRGTYFRGWYFWNSFIISIFIYLRSELPRASLSDPHRTYACPSVCDLSSKTKQKRKKESNKKKRPQTHGTVCLWGGSVQASVAYNHFGFSWFRYSVHYLCYSFSPVLDFLFLFLFFRCSDCCCLPRIRVLFPSNFVTKIFISSFHHTFHLERASLPLCVRVCVFFPTFF